MMMTLSSVEEDYMKAIYKIFERTGNPVNTNAIADIMATSPASVTDMIKRLSEKEMLNYERYKGVSLKIKGNNLVTQIVRKHRLWEAFLVEKLGFRWDEVHEIAEQLEHIQSEKLTDKLEEFLGFPKFDPHGDPIPDRMGKFVLRSRQPVSDVTEGGSCMVVGVLNHTALFLQYLDSQKIALGTQMTVLERFAFDQSIKVLISKNYETVLSAAIAKNILVKNL